MTGMDLLGLILLSMAWLFSLGALAFNLADRRRPLRYWPGVAGSLTVLFTLPAFPARGVEVAWPWLWVLLPFVLDPGSLPMIATTAFHRLRGKSTPPFG
jgi:hypothetical protein